MVSPIYPSAPAYAWLTSAEDPARAPEPGMVTLPVPGQWLGRRNVGDVLTLHDARGAKRQFTVISLDAGGVVATTDKTTYVATGTTFHVDRADDPTEVGLLPELEQSLVLRPGDMLNVTRDCSPAPSDPDGVPWIGCTLPEVFDHARVGEKIYFDDGRIGGEIIAAGHDLLRVRIDRAAASGSKLRAAKGINVPDTRLPVPALTEKDISDLATAVEVADFVDMSFVQDPVRSTAPARGLDPPWRRPVGRGAQDRDTTGVRAAPAVATDRDAQTSSRRDDRARRPRGRGGLRTAGRTAGRDSVAV